MRLDVRSEGGALVAGRWALQSVQYLVLTETDGVAVAGLLGSDYMDCRPQRVIERLPIFYSVTAALGSGNVFGVRRLNFPIPRSTPPTV